MTTTTVLLLACLWAAVLVPGAWRDHRRSPRSTVDGFSTAMERLATCDKRRVYVHGGGGRRAVYPSPSRREVLLERRRMVLARLAGGTGVTLLTALLAGGAWWFLSVLAIGVLGAYVAALRTIEVRRAEAERVVTRHPAAVRDRGEGGRWDDDEATLPRAVAR